MKILPLYFSLAFISAISLVYFIAPKPKLIQKENCTDGKCKDNI